MNKPNILHIFTDMQRADTIAALGNPVIKTPNLDKLCGDGVAFTNAFSPSPVCISARCSMIHGQYPHNTGCYENTPMPTDGRQSIMDVLASAGYRTHGIGKCHFSPDRYALRGFMSREIQEEGGADPADLPKNPYLAFLRDNGYEHICEAYGIRGEMYYIPQPSQVPARYHPTQWIGDRATTFINDGTNGDPWYLFASFIHPHPPFTPPNPWHKLYRPSLMPLPVMPDDVQALHTFINKVQNRYKYRDQGRDINLIRAIKAYYYACISFIDFQVGRLIEALKSTGQYENTIVIFTSDHGEYLGDYGCWGKRGMHDPSARVPMILRVPGRLEGGGVCDSPVSLVDIAPTFANAGGAEFTSHSLDGEDLVEVAEGSCSRRFVISQLSVGRGMASRARGRNGSPSGPELEAERIASGSSYMCVSRECKYFYSAPDDREFLFDRRSDPLETRNRAGVEFCGDALTEHKGALLNMLKNDGETAGIEDDDWISFPVRSVDSDPDTGLLIQDSYTPWADMSIPGYTDR